MTKLTRKLFMSVFAVAFAVIALATTTFAWMALNNTASVSSINATVGADSGIEISFSNANNTYQSNLTFSSSYLESTFRLKAVTPDDLSGTPSYQMLTATSATFTPLALSSTNGNVISAAKGDLLAFDLWIRTAPGSQAATDPGVVTLVSLDYSKTKFTDDTNIWPADIQFTDSKGETVNFGGNYDCGPADAARLMIYNSDGSTGSVAQQTAAQNVIFEMNDVGTATVNTEGFCDYGKGSIDYFNKKSGLATPPIASGGTYEKPTPYTTIKHDASKTETEVLGTDEVVFAVLSEGTAIKVTVFIWIEGWDGECFNALFEEVLNVQFYFSSQVVSKL